jgi:hypothetical protein
MQHERDWPAGPGYIPRGERAAKLLELERANFPSADKRIPRLDAARR